MPFLLMLVMLAAATAEAPRGTIEATIRGTAQPLEVGLLLRGADDDWKEVAHRSLPAGTRRLRFEGLESGVYQIHLRGSLPTEQLGTKIAVGTGDTRRTTIAVEPFSVSGRVLLGDTSIGAGALVLRHRELRWSADIPLMADGTFRAPVWQRGTFASEVRGAALPTPYLGEVELGGESSVLNIAIPDGRIVGTVRDANSGAPVEGAVVALQTSIDDREEHVKLTTGPEGRFEFTGIKDGRHTVRIVPPRHLVPDPILFSLGSDARLRELDVRVEPGRAVAIVVIDADNDPVANAQVLAVAESKLRARTATDEDGRAVVSVPDDDAATLFVIPAEGAFGMLRVGREHAQGRLKVYLPRTSSSLLIRARTTEGENLPPFSLLMRYNGELVPPEVGEELTAVQGLQLMTGPESEAHLRNIPSGSYEFWPYRSEREADSIVATAAALLAPIQVNVRSGENSIAVKFAPRPFR
jgi:hypothetical protein